MKLRHDNRAFNTTLTHALTLSITVILMAGIILAATSFFDSNQQQVAEEELRTIGNRIATDVTQATSLAERGGQTNITTEHPERVAGTSYDVKVLSGSDCADANVDTDTCIRLDADEMDVSTTVPVENETAFTIEPGRDGAFTVTTLNGGGITTTDAPSRVQDVDVSSQVGVGSSITRISSVSLTEPGNQPPAASFTFSPSNPDAGTNIEFDASGSSDPDGSIQEYRWDWDDDGTFEDTTSSPTITKSLSAGKSNVTLEVDDGNAIANETKSIDVSGLAYQYDLDTNGADNRVAFSVKNEFSEDIVLRQLLVDPEDDSISLDDGGDPELGITATTNGYVDYNGPINLDGGGEFINFDEEGDENGGYVQLDDGDTATFELQDFTENVDEENITFGVKYKYGSSGTFNTTVFTDEVGGPDVTISNYEVINSGQDVDVTFDSNRQLDDIEADVTIDGTPSGTLTDDSGDFVESGSGPYTYTADVSTGSDGTFEVELTTAESMGIPSSDTPVSDSLIIGATPTITWQSQSDWDAITVDDGHLVHANFGDHAADEVTMGYDTSGSGLVGYWPLDGNPATSSVAPDESGVGNDDVTISNNPQQWASGMGDSSAYDFDGYDLLYTSTSDELDLSDTDRATVSMWVRLDSTYGGTKALVANDYDDSDYSLRVKYGNIPRFGIEDFWFEDTDNSNGINTGWHHIVGRFDGKRNSIWIDGNLKNEECVDSDCDAEGIVDDDEYFSIGAGVDYPHIEDPLDGKIDEVRVYEESLSASEIESLSNAYDDGTFTTDYQTAGSGLNQQQLKLEYDVDRNSQDIEVKVITDDGDESDWVTLNSDSGTQDISSGLPSGTEDTYRLKVKLESNDVTESPVVNKLTLKQ